MSSDTVVLFFGDIFGRTGRRAVAHVLPKLKEKYQPDFIIGNVENLSGGKGINKKTYQEMIDIGFHGFTGGNHIWDNKDVLQLMENQKPIVRPANFPSSKEDPCPGKGYLLVRNVHKGLWIVNLMGRLFMDTLDCPFHTVNRVLKEIPDEFPILVDMHADATSEKYAMGWHLDGRVGAVVGTHSHVQTADERILPGGTAYITDVGLSGSFNSVIGMDSKAVVKRFMNKRPIRPELATENPGICCVVITLRDNKAIKIERIREEVKLADDFSHAKDET